MPVFLIHVTSSMEWTCCIPYRPQKVHGVQPPTCDWAGICWEMNPQTKVYDAKRQWGCLLRNWTWFAVLRRRKIEPLVLCGVSTNIAWDNCQRSVSTRVQTKSSPQTLCAANSKDEHEATLKYIFPRIGLLRTNRRNPKSYIRETFKNLNRNHF